jgi:hypothetical protein
MTAAMLGDTIWAVLRGFDGDAVANNLETALTSASAIFLDRNKGRYQKGVKLAQTSTS